MDTEKKKEIKPETKPQKEKKSKLPIFVEVEFTKKSVNSGTKKMSYMLAKRLEAEGKVIILKK